MVSMLISEQANPLKNGPCGLSPIAIALGAREGRAVFGGSRIGPGHIACALRLARELKAGWGKQVDSRGETVLGRLYRSIGRFELLWMDQLYRAGADPRAVNERGWSLLRMAAEWGSPSCSLKLARWAAARGANASTVCHQGQFADEVAQVREKYELAQYLRALRERGTLESQLVPASSREGRRRL
jgi:hypothetical protein